MGNEPVKRGTVVTIQFGPFALFKGMVTATLPRRVVVRITLKKRAILVELDRDMVASYVAARKGRSATIAGGL
jgi:transcription antitermination factor NusG